MRARIHRGASEIGGNCIEVEAAGHRLLLDLGWPLNLPFDADLSLPEVAGLSSADPSLLGVIISHPHLDHYGLARKVPAAVPFYEGEAAYNIMREAAFFTGAGMTVEPAGFLRHRQPFTLGPFTVTPYLIDHSAFDSYCLLVEADGRRLFYSGDVRAHGRKPGTFLELLRDPPADVDALVLEGTSIRPDADGSERAITEAEVEDACVGTFRATPGMVLALFSPQNIDRLVTMYRSAIRSDRDLVLDLYAAAVAAATGRETIPQAHWDRVRVYLPHGQRMKVIQSAEFHRTDAVRPRRIYPEELRERSGKLVTIFRTSMAREMEKAGCLVGAHAVWSMWPGYLREPSGEKLKAFLDRLGIGMTIHHASGHAAVPDLQRLVEAVAPRKVVPIHTSAADRFREFVPSVEQHGDGEWWDVA
ncbi:MAG: MBL fold metallo-hydrolase [Deltaproteobacteria bacterium]|nr:MBL fold metallo-hydrolase [Deltaproteobacteria bacterium]